MIVELPSLSRTCLPSPRCLCFWLLTTRTLLFSPRPVRVIGFLDSWFTGLESPSIIPRLFSHHWISVSQVTADVSDLHVG
ncbi:hypothetical protein GDO78_016743 [Eleutherodactylus coqui]|uniref:Uncharacterized protein n=1 Tax=Eleutherodactylus coqui TaxID=57060 RepID=A0A8J6B079_ELECQ|nr:hypothetical protein GDO78_016743 [Eleutherodactylus coqui]